MEEQKKYYQRAKTGDGKLMAFDLAVNPWINSEMNEKFVVYPVDEKTLAVDEQNPYELERGYIDELVHIKYEDSKNTNRSL